MTTPARVVCRHRDRAELAVLVLVLVTSALAAKAVAEAALADGHSIELGVVQLQLSSNSGVAFSLGAGLPRWVILAVTGLVTLVLAGYAWRTAPTTSAAGRVGLAAILAGAIANVADRTGDGAVTDYLHTGWWPTFNLADTFITVGAPLVVITTLRGSPEVDR